MYALLTALCIEGKKCTTNWLYLLHGVL